jgi:hypothetical protein
MTEIRVITENLPGYKFPYSNVIPDSVIGYTLVQAKSDGVWEPRWCLVDMDGNPIAIFEADSFDDMSAGIVAQKAADFVMDMHELGFEETGNETTVALSRHDNESFSFEFE